jgi:uncharacterized protein
MHKEWLMRRALFAFVGVALLVAVPPAVGLNTDIPSTGLPSASDFSSSLLTELKGVVSWKTLSKVEPRIKDGQIVPKFSDEILGLDKKSARVQGFILPLDLGDKQHHFLLSAVPPHCPFCLPAGPEAIVEVLAQQKVEYGFEPIIMSGKFVVLQNDPSGLLYRLTEAEPIALGRE